MFSNDSIDSIVVCGMKVIDYTINHRIYAKSRNVRGYVSLAFSLYSSFQRGESGKRQQSCAMSTRRATSRSHDGTGSWIISCSYKYGLYLDPYKRRQGVAARKKNAKETIKILSDATTNMQLNKREMRVPFFKDVFMRNMLLTNGASKAVSGWHPQLLIWHIRLAFK